MAELRQIVRIIHTDIVGTKQVSHGLTQISGIGFPFSEAVCAVLNIDKHQKLGHLEDNQIKKIEEVIKNPLHYNIPPHLLNRRKDPETGKDLHITSSDLRLAKEFDIKMFKKIKSYKGIRHALNLPVRGQKTRSNFRKGKSIGVSKKRKSKKG